MSRPPAAGSAGQDLPSTGVSRDGGLVVNAHRNPCAAVHSVGRAQRDGLPGGLQHRLGGGESTRAGWDSRNIDARPTGPESTRPHSL